MAKTPLGTASRATMEGIGRRIMLRRQALGLTQRELHERAGVHGCDRWERGLVAPGALALIALSQALDCSIDWLLKGGATQEEE